MPHIIVEHSANVAVALPALFESFHDALAQLGVEIDECRSRAYRCDVYRVGTGRARGFVHVTLAVLDRRPPELQRAAGERLLAILQRSVAFRCDLTVEVRPMRTDGYFKAIA